MAISRMSGISPEGYIAVKEVASKLGVGKTTVWAIAKSDPSFPKRRKFGARTTRWREDEIDEWLARRICEVEGAAL